MNLIDCGREHAEAIQAIFNEVIEGSTYHYDCARRSHGEVVEWLEAKAAAGLPVIGLADDAGGLAGFATWGPFRPQHAYRHTVEHSVYVQRDFRGRGFGRQLLEVVIARAREEGYHLLVGVIDSSNAASIRLHQELGFVHAGRIREAGRKFERWLDVDFYQLILAG
jgi:L-amino acid N-acyltransferase